MSYLYENLKTALGGEKVVSSRNTVIRDWSPNNIRAIFIARNFILVIKHIGGIANSKIVPLEVNEVYKDIEEIRMSGNVRPKLNSLLSKRSLSCLEEIYIDSLFINYQQVIDLSSYVNDLVNNLSRLRYFGYGDFSKVDAKYIIQSYSNSKMGYSLAKDSSREGIIKLEYKEVENKTWYSNYYLRPQYYTMDSEKGKLSLHFKKVENDIKTLGNKAEDEYNEKVKLEAINKIISFDEKNKNYLQRLDDMGRLALNHKDDKVWSILVTSFLSVLDKKRVVEGFTPKYSRNSDSLIESYYKKLNIYDTEKRDMSVKNIKEYIESNKGFIDLFELLDDFSYTFASNLRKEGYSDLVGVSLIVNKDIMPKCKVNSNAYGEYLEGMFTFISDLVGENI